MDIHDKAEAMLLVDKRLQKELENSRKNPIDGIRVLPNDDNLREWYAYLTGQPDTPYVGGTFKLHIVFPDRYPFEPPKVRFDTPIVHPNINIDGKLCISILRDDWQASMTVQKVLLSILSLLSSPNPNDPLMPEIADLYKTDYHKYESIAKKFTKKHAMNTQ